MNHTKALQLIIRLGVLLLLFLSIFVFYKLKPIWAPVLDLFMTILSPFIVAGFITYLLHPIIKRLHHAGIPRSLAIMMIYLLFFGGIGFVLYKGVPVLLSQLKELAVHLPGFIELYRDLTRQLYENTANFPEGLHDKFDQGLAEVEQKLDTLISGTLNMTKGLVNSLILFAIIPIIVFYMLKDYKLMKKSIWYITPAKWRKPLIRFWKDIDKTLGNYIRGQLLVCAIIGFLAAVGFWIAGIPYPLILGLIVGVTNIIPYFGPFFGMVPAAIIAFTVSLKSVLIVIGLIAVLQFLEGNVLGPLVVGKSLHMHPVFIMFALLLGGELAGVTGLILAVPLFAVLKTALLHVRAYYVKH